MRVLVDTSVWSAALRRSKPKEAAAVREMRDLVLEGRVAVIGPIRQEILSGLRESAQFERLENHLAAFPDLPLEMDDFVTAAKFFNTCRANGIQGSNTDFLICSVAVRRQLAIYTTNRDFSHFAQYLPITLHETRGLAPGKRPEP